ncbi:MAG: DUF58 domain-containing protein [Actinomycetia bacterium]|nr:DUF58 domain-containing protein [Actinomycetes bacterium]
MAQQTGVENEAFRHETNLRKLELAVTRKLDGFLHGENLTTRHGPGSERGEGRVYQPGDDARRIDWSVTARMNELHVRDTIADRELETWLVVDGTASLDFGTRKWEKRDLALTAAGAFGLLGARAGNRVGALIYDSDGVNVLPPKGGRKSVMQVLRRLDRRPRGTAPSADLSEALATVRRTARRRGRVVVISDFIDTGDWPAELRRLGLKQDVIVASITDPRELELPPSGLISFVDPESGDLVEIQTSNKKFRRRFAAEAQARADARRDAIHKSGARHVELSTDRDWMLDLVAFVNRTGRTGLR